MGDRLIALNVNTKIPRFDQYLGVWAVEEFHGEALVARIGELDVGAHLEAERATDFKSTFIPPIDITADGVAVIPIEGTLTKYGGSLTGVGTVGIRRQLRKAADDESVTAIVLKIDSPGGSVKGIGDLVQDIVETKADKPVWAFIEDWAASAAYVIASATDRIVSSSAATVIGSLGVFTVLHDSSDAAERHGIKVHVVKSAKFKGGGTPGTKITDEQLSEVERHVRDVHDMLIVGIVGENRAAAGLDINAVDDGRVWVASDAMDLGLIDEINTLDSVVEKIASVAGRGDPPTGNGETIMSKEAVAVLETTAATVGELLIAFPDADAKFHLDCLEKQVTMQGAQSAYIDRLRADSKAKEDRIKALSDEADELRAASEGQKNKAGGEPVEETASGSAPATDARQEWRDLVGKHSARFNGDRTRGAIAANRERPDLRMQVVEAVNI